MSLFDESLFDGDGPWSPAAPPTPPEGYLGRFQLGNTIPLLVVPVDGADFPTAPDAAPYAVVTSPDDEVVATIKLAMIGDDLHFGASYDPGIALSLGTYTVAYSYFVAGGEGGSTGSFDLIPGGDPGGRVISMVGFDRPEARYVVAQLSSGRIVQGRNPRL